jgi:hypothetical protein
LLFDQWFLVLNQGYFFLYRVFAFSIIGCFLEANLLFSFSGRFYAFLFFVPAAIGLKNHDSIFSMFRSARIDGSLAGIVIFRSFQVLFVSGLPGEVPAYSLVHTRIFFHPRAFRCPLPFLLLGKGLRQGSAVLHGLRTVLNSLCNNGSPNSFPSG